MANIRIALFRFGLGRSRLTSPPSGSTSSLWTAHQRLPQPCCSVAGLPSSPLGSRGYTVVQNGGPSTNTSSPTLTSKPTQNADTDNDVFADLISSDNLGQHMVEYRVGRWQEIINNLKKLDSEVSIDIQRLCGNHMDAVTKFCMKPTAPIALKARFLQVLLTADSDLPETHKLLNQTVADASSLPYKVLSDTISCLTSASKTSSRESVRRELVINAVNKRCHEIPAKQIVFFMYQLDNLFEMKTVCASNRQIARLPKGKRQDIKQPDVKANQLEGRCVALCDQFKMQDLARIIQLLGRWRSRNEPLLNAALHRLSSGDLTTLSFTQCTNVVSACSALRLHHSEFLSNVCDRLLHEDSPWSPAVATSLLSSLASLRWRDPKLLARLLDELQAQVGRVRWGEARSVMRALATLQPPLPLGDAHAQLVIDLCNKQHSQAPEYPHEPDTVSVAYSLAVLLLLSGDLALAALHPDTAQSVLANLPTSRKAAEQLCQLDACVEGLVSGYTGPRLADGVRTQLAKETKDPASEELFQPQSTLNLALVNCVKKFADLSTYTVKDASTPSGVPVALVLCATNKGDLRPSSSLSSPNSQQSLHRLALTVVPFNGICRPNGGLTGSYAIQAMALRRADLVPVQVLYSDLASGTTTAVSNVQARIRRAVADHLLSSADQPVRACDPAPSSEAAVVRDSEASSEEIGSSDIKDSDISRDIKIAETQQKEKPV